MLEHDMTENPGWVDKIVKQQCAELEAYAQAHDLPMPLLDKCKPAKEFGCGHYGCVMATSDPGIVFKITSDESEAHFIACYQKLRDKLPFDSLEYSGIVDYKAIVGLKESSKQARRVYAIWREEAQNVGDWDKGWMQHLKLNKADKIEWEYHRRQTFEVSQLVARFRLYADKIRKSLKPELSKRNDAKWQLIADKFTQPHSAVTHFLEECKEVAKLLANAYLGDRLGNTLDFFLQQGLLLADVHHGNLGNRGTGVEAIITDPGHLVILKPKWEHVSIVPV